MLIYKTTFHVGFSLLITGILSAQPVSFNQDIRPILIENCTTCHGGVKQAGEVSFIYRQQALGKGKSGKTIIVPGKPEQSELIRRITTSDPDDRMPPPKEHPKALTKEQIDLLTQWIKQGAQWQEHWAFVPPKEQPPSSLSDPSWPRQSLDTFILAKLDQEKLKPSPEASPSEWLRRVTFDLTGLPPTEEEIDLFTSEEKKHGDKAYQQVTDRLLKSPHYGERWTGMWMDLARYSDSKGYEKDRHRDMWPYRDWLINAFNADMPFDQFTRDQLAGDLKPDQQWHDLVASMFHRNTQTNEEGGTDDEEYRLNAMIDRVNTTWTVWQASTFGCAQCHDHPYDPIRHEDFYRFSAFFNNTEDADLDSEHPTIKLPTEPQKAHQAIELGEKANTIRQALNQDGHTLLHADKQWSIVTPKTVKTSHGKIDHNDQGVLQTSGTQAVGTRFNLTFEVTSFNALRLTIYPDEQDPKKAPFRGSVLSHLTAILELPDGTKTPLTLKEVFADSLTGPYDPMGSLSKGGAGFGAYPKLFKIRQAAFVPEKAIDAPANSKLHITIQHQASTSGGQAVPLRQFRWETSDNSQWQSIVLDQTRVAQWQQYRTLKNQQKKLGGTTIPVMRDRPESALRETRLFARGSFIAKEQIVTPGTPVIFNSMPKENANNRLGMANWLTHNDNPLTARVIVNRIWSECFGMGIVETLGDFGSSGQKPSHLELLDHLALRLQRDHAWSLKKLLREMVLSATYRQSHQVSKELLKKDPRNRLLARGPRTRLTAEMIRDQALLTSGLLNRKTHGPSVMPAQPEGVWQTVYSGAKWTTSKNGEQHRRALYTYWKRTSPYPSLLTFDASSREICTPRRIATNTPLQALVTMNDPAYLECAQALATRMIKKSSNLDEQIRFALLTVNNQSAQDKVVQSIVSLYQDTLKIYQNKPDLAKQLASTPEEAALVLCANAMLNTDDALTK